MAYAPVVTGKTHVRDLSLGSGTTKYNPTTGFAEGTEESFAEGKAGTLHASGNQLGLQYRNPLMGQRFDSATPDMRAALAVDQAGATSGAGTASMGVGNRLTALADAPQGPSAGRAMLQQGGDRSMRAALAMAKSGRGVGQGAALRQASMNNQATMADVSGRSAQIAAEEDAAFRNRQISALQGANTAYGTGAQAYGSAAGTYGDVRGLDLDTERARTDYLTAQNQAALGWDRSIMDRERLGYDYLTSDANMRAQWTALQLGADEERARLAGEQAAAMNANRAADAAQRADWMKTGATAVGTMAAASDRRLKEDVRPAPGMAEALGRNVKNFDYRYKDPAAFGQGPYTGPMAQDIEAAGLDGIVQDTPQGKMLDGSRAGIVGLGVSAEQQREIEDLRKQVEALKNG